MTGRRLRFAPAVVAALAAVTVLSLTPGGGASSAGRAACPPDMTGRVVFVRDGSLHLLELSSCAERLLPATGARAPVAWSPDGGWIDAGGRLFTSGGQLAARWQPPAGATVAAWASRGHALALLTRRGGLVLGGPRLRTRRLLADGWGASGAIFARNGTVAVARDLRTGSGPRAVGKPKRQEIWLLRPPAMRPQRIYTGRAGQDLPPALAAVSPDGEAVAFWPLLDHANSANLDGRPLELVISSNAAPRPLTKATLVARDFVSWCGEGLVAVAGFDRMTTVNKSLVIAAPPGWRPRTLVAAAGRSWVSPACSPDGRTLAVAAGPNREDVPFGREGRSIWLVPVDGGPRVRLTPPPPAGYSDETPRFTASGRFVLFVRSGPTDRNANAAGRLYAVEAGGTHRVFGPIADLGSGGNYYGRYGWDIAPSPR